MNSKLKKVLALGLSAIMTISVVGCAAKADDKPSEKPQEPNQSEQKVSGKVTMSGSTSMEKLAKALIEDFREINSDITVTAEFVGSSTGVKQCLEGTVNIGNASRNLKDEEKSNGAVENIVAIDGIAVIISPDNKIDSVSKEQLSKIYTGEIKNWSEVGGEDSPIVVIGRESGSGTRGAFEELLKVEDLCSYAQELNSTGAVKTTVSSDKDAIGYISLDVVDDTVKAVKLDGVEASEKEIVAGNYSLSRPFVMTTKGDIKDQDAATQEFLNYVYSERGQEIVKSVGLITAK